MIEPLKEESEALGKKPRYYQSRLGVFEKEFQLEMRNKSLTLNTQWTGEVVGLKLEMLITTCRKGK